MQDISFTYSDAPDQAIFTNLSLTIPAGQKIGLIGRSGGGKSTLTRLLLRFNDINSGEILVDGQDIRHVTQSSLREAITYVPQEPLLFHRSIFDNIAYARPTATKDEVIKAAKLAYAHEFVQALPSGYATLVGERGVKLSGGQRQRIAIARAILKNAHIVILDEATSALDSESEHYIQKAMAKLLKSRTAIVVAHRLSTIAALDRIIVIDNGVIKEDGSHSELLRKKGIYWELWERQSGGFLEEDE